MIEIYEYVMESARFEIENGNNEYIAIFEEAEASVIKENDNWFKRFISNAKKFVKSILQKVKMLFNKIKVFSIKKKSEKLSEMLDKKNKQGTALIYDTEKMIALTASLKRATHSSMNIQKDIESLLNNEKTTNYDAIDIDEKTKRSYIFRIGFTYDNCKEFLDDIVKSVNMLNQNINNLSSIISKYSDRSKSDLRIAISTVYSTCTKYISNSFKLTKEMISEFIKISTKEVNDLNNATINIEKADEDFRKTLDECEKDYNELSKKLDEFKKRNKK